MEKVKAFFKKALDKICFGLFAVFFILTYPLYKRAMKELENITD